MKGNEAASGCHDVLLKAADREQNRLFTALPFVSPGRDRVRPGAEAAPTALGSLDDCLAQGRGPQRRKSDCPNLGFLRPTTIYFWESVGH